MDAHDVISPPEAATEIAADQRAERTKLKSEALAMRALMAQPGWKLYMEMIERASNIHLTELLKPLDSALGAVRTEYHKGTLNGLSAASQLPAAKIREAVATIGSDFLDAE